MTTLKKNVRKEVAEDKKEIKKTGGGSFEYKDDPVKQLALSLMNEKTVFGLDSEFGGDHIMETDIILEIEEHNIPKQYEKHNYVILQNEAIEQTTIESVPSTSMKCSNTKQNCEKPKENPIGREVSSTIVEANFDSKEVIFHYNIKVLFTLLILHFKSIHSFYKVDKINFILGSNKKNIFRTRGISQV